MRRINWRAAIKGEPLTNVWFAFPQCNPIKLQLTGQRVTHIATRGKALLTHFSGGLTLYSHNQLYGVWRVVDAGVEPQSNSRTARQAADRQQGDFALQRVGH